MYSCWTLRPETQRAAVCLNVISNNQRRTQTFMKLWIFTWSMNHYGRFAALQSTDLKERKLSAWNLSSENNQHVQSVLLFTFSDPSVSIWTLSRKFWSFSGDFVQLVGRWHGGHDQSEDFISVAMRTSLRENKTFHIINNNTFIIDE